MAITKAHAATTTRGIVIPMSLKKETKGTFVYAAESDTVAIKSVYVNKSAFPKGAPDSITIVLAK